MDAGDGRATAGMEDDIDTTESKDARAASGRETERQSTLLLIAYIDDKGPESGSESDQVAG